MPNHLKRYRYRGQYGWIYIMAMNTDDAIAQAKLSLWRGDPPDVGKLEIFNQQTLQFEKAAP